MWCKSHFLFHSNFPTLILEWVFLFKSVLKFLHKKSPNKLMLRLLYSRWDLNPYGHYCPLDFKSSVSTNSTTWALVLYNRIERKTGFEPATLTLARWCSTPELLSRSIFLKNLHIFQCGCKVKTKKEIAKIFLKYFK